MSDGELTCVPMEFLRCSPTVNMAVFGERVFQEVTTLNEVIRMGPSAIWWAHL